MSDAIALGSPDIHVGDSVLHLADRDSDLLVSGVVRLVAELEGCEQALVDWSNVAEPVWSPVANLIRIPS